jgi:hypothetical protein
MGGLRELRRITQFSCPNLSENYAARMRYIGDKGRAQGTPLLRFGRYFPLPEVGHAYPSFCCWIMRCLISCNSRSFSSVITGPLALANAGTWILPPLPR